MQIENISSVIITGSMAYDDIMDFPGLFKDHFHPENLHQINVSFAVDKLEKQIGGTGTNITYNAQCAYKNKTVPIILLGAVGKDGADVIQFLKKNNCNTKGILVDQKQFTATGKVITDKNNNQIWGFYYGASSESKKLQLSKYADKNSLIVISANHADAFLSFQNQCIKNKFPYLYDPGMSLTWIKDHDLLNGVLHAKYLVGNDYEIAMIMKRLNKSISELINNGLQVITTLGKKGVKYESNKSKVYKVHKVDSYKVRKVIDPTGAGDAWRGGFIAGLLKKLPLRDCLKLGNVMASFAVESYGTVNHKPTQNQILSRLANL